MPNANIDYVTSHQGQAHITTQNVIDLLAGLSGDVSGIKKFPQLYNGLSHEITDALTIQVKTGAALAGGSFFILEEAFDWMLDPGAVGYSRIDVLYVVMSEDPDTAVQSCDFVYEVGNLYPNGTTGTVPSAPTGTNITATYPFLRMDMTDGSIVSVTDYSTPYLSNSSLVTTVNELVEQLEQDVGGTVEQVQTNTNEIAQMKVTFQDGVDTIYNSIVAEGVTPTASTPSALATAVGSVYDKGKTDAESVIWEQTLYINATLLAYSNAPMKFGTVLNCYNMIKLKMTQCESAVSGVTWEFLNASGSLISNGAFSLNTDVQVPSNAVKLHIIANKNSTSSTNNSVTFIATNQAKLIHS